jgi:hypothetical protein
MSTITIPPAVVEAVAVAEWDAERARIGDYTLPLFEDYTLPLFEELHPVVKELKLENAHTACLAMLKAWPGAFPWTFTGPLEGHSYVLPLPPQEASDDRL